MQIELVHPAEHHIHTHTFGSLQWPLLFDTDSTQELSAMRMKSQPFFVMFPSEYRRQSAKKCM